MKRIVLVFSLSLLAWLAGFSQSTRSGGWTRCLGEGDKGVFVSYNDIGSTVLAFRLGGERIYGVLGAGYNWRMEGKHSMVWEAGIGAHIGHGAFFNTEFELKASSLSLFSDRGATQYSLSLLPGLKLTRQWEVFIGPTLNYLRTAELANATLFDRGIHLWKRFGSSRMEQLYIGFSAGLYYRF